MDWFLYDRNLLHETVKQMLVQDCAHTFFLKILNSKAIFSDEPERIRSHILKAIFKFIVCFFFLLAQVLFDGSTPGFNLVNALVLCLLLQSLQIVTDP